MPPRKAPAAPAAVAVAPVPVDPDAGVTFADHRMAAGMLLRALAGLAPFEALERLRGLYAGLPNGTARRAVLAARLAILRDNLPEPVAMPAPVVEEPVVVVVPKAPKAAALSTLALEEAARMLMEAATPEEDAPAAKAKPAPPVAVADLFAALAAEEEKLPSPVAEWDGFDATAGDAGDDPAAADPQTLESDDILPGAGPEAEPEPEPVPTSAQKPSRAKAKPRKGKAAEAEGAGFVAKPPQAMAVSLPDLSALDALSTPAPGFDLGAAFAALSDSDDPPLSPPDDLTRADTARFAGVADAEEAPATPQPARKAKTGLAEEDIAASLSALIEEASPAVTTPPAMPDAEVSDRLTQLETAFAEQAKAKPKRKMPTDLSDVSAAFAALDGGAADDAEA